MSRIMPGRVVDIVLAAVAAAGQTPYGIEVRYRVDEVPYVALHLLGTDPSGGTSLADAQAVCARLGVLGELSWRGQLGYVTAHVPALGTRLQILVSVLPGPDAAPAASVEALVGQVDAARAAETAEQPLAPTVVIRAEGPDSPITLRISPDCATPGKCGSCTGDAWDAVEDHLIDCEHDCHYDDAAAGGAR